jgi:hypothetical protein
MCKKRGPILKLVEYNDVGHEYTIKSIRLSTNIDKAIRQQRKLYENRGKYQV